MGTQFKIGTRFNDVITKEIIRTWKNENIILNGATGSGKTYLIENNLYTYARDNFKSILYLCNRTALFDQVLLEVKEESLRNIDVMLYQTLQSKILQGESVPHYDYIACDEWHYILCDAIFNVYTDLTYDWIMEQNKSVKIFMSGTAQNIFNKLKTDEVVKDEFEYIIPYDYSYAKECKIYKDKFEAMNIINHILTNTDDKVIYFANSTDFAIEVYNQFKDDAYFRCSTESKNDEAKEINAIDCITTHSKDLITFDKRLLITTKALDNGIDIRDKNVKHIICDVFDLESAQQCLGRKRKIDDTDTCTFYIRNYSKKSIGNFKGGLNKNLNPVRMFIENREEFNEKYGKDRKWHNNFIYFDGDVRLHNRLAYWKMECDSSDIETMELISYKELFLGRLGDTLTNIIDLEELEEIKLKDELEIYLDEIKGIQLDKEKQEELINKIDLKDKKHRQQKSIGQLNMYLIENYNKTLSTKRVRTDGKQVTIWILVDVK